MTMILLHISDIHFRAPQCNTDDDPNKPYRTRLLNDVRKRVQQLGNVDAILVGGDIAFRADPTEYQAAFTWLTELAKASSCAMEKVYVIPGNHDINRGAIAEKASIRNVHKAINDAIPAAREKELQDQLKDELSARALFEPLTAYNDFAKQFSCQVYPGKLYWRQNLAFDNGVALRLYGLTSTLLSGAVNAKGQDDTKDSLYLSPAQTVFDPVENVINLVMSHHPPDWFMDQDEVENAIQGRAALHFFGHRHRQRIMREAQYMRFDAGAVNPDKNEPAWHPAYNLIKLSMNGDGDARVLNIEAYQMQWQANPEGYTCVQSPEKKDEWAHTIRCPGVCIAAPQSAALTPAPTKGEEIKIAKNETEAAMGDLSTRQLVLKWWQLPMDARREIALDLGLISDDEIKLPEAERYGRALLRAGQRNMLEKLKGEIEKWQNK